MKLKNSSLEIPHDNIFQNDKLKRQKSVSNLAVLLKSVSSPLVFSVNAPWGAGKTTFMKMLNSTLNTADTKSIYFSAWETDFALDPLLAFIGEMNVGLSQYIDGNEEKSKAWSTAKAAGAHILRRSIPVGVKMATAGLLDFDKVFEDEASKLAESLTKDVVDNYSKDKEAIAIFKNNVAKVLKAEGSKSEKMFIFVDELDRCRPTYAIELLERIKHLLDIEGLVFILALDKVQLAHSVRAVYGSEFDALGYLKRFIDVEFVLPSPDTESFVEHLFAELELDQYFAARNNRETVQDKQSLLDMLSVVTQSMSLRSIEQLLSKVKLISLTVNKNQYFYPEFVVFLLVAKDRNYEIYSDFSQAAASGAELVLLLNLVLPGERLVWTRQYIEGLIIAGKMQGARDWAESRIKSLKDEYNSTDSDESKKFNAGRILEVIDVNIRMGRGMPLRKVLDRIDLLSDFEFD